MLGDAKLAQQFAARLLDEGIYVTGFFLPSSTTRASTYSYHKCQRHTPQNKLNVLLLHLLKIGKQLNVIA